MRFRANISKMFNLMKLELQVNRWIWFWNFRFLLGIILKTYFPKTYLFLGLYSLSLTFDNSSFYITFRHKWNKTIRIKSLMTSRTHILTSQYLSHRAFFWIGWSTNKDIVNKHSSWHNNFITYLFLIKKQTKNKIDSMNHCSLSISRPSLNWA